MKLHALIAAVAALHATVTEARPEMVERLGETTVQKIDAAVRDVESTMTEAQADPLAANDAGLADAMDGMPSPAEFLAEARGWIAERQAAEKRSEERGERALVALEAIAKTLSSVVTAGPQG